MSFRLVGLDPGFASIGFAVLDLGHGRPRVTEFGVFHTEASAKKRHVLSTEDNVRRTQEIARWLRLLVASPDQTLAIAAEAMSFPRSSSAAAKMALAWGCIASLAEVLRLPVLQASPTMVKHGVCGVKTATKEEVQAACAKLYPEIVPLRAAMRATQWEHPHDALAVAHLMLGSDVVKMIRRVA